MTIFDQLWTLYKLKEVNRSGLVKERPESTAEHVFSTLFLAQYFLKKVKEPLDEQKITRMILYHDLPEIEAGDTFILDEEKMKTKNEREHKAFESLKKQLPLELREEIESIWHEFEAGTTREAQFVKAVDALDPIIQAMDYPELWIKHGFNEEILRNKKEHLLEPFPELLDFFNQLIEHFKIKKILK